MKTENIHTLGRIVVGTTVAVSTVLASVSHYYFYNKCLDWFNFEPKTHQDQNTPPIVTNYEQAICFTAPFITDFVIIAGSVQCTGTLFFGTSFKFWQPFANMLNAGGIASCLMEQEDTQTSQVVHSSIPITADALPQFPDSCVVINHQANLLTEKALSIHDRHLFHVNPIKDSPRLDEDQQEQFIHDVWRQVIVATDVDNLSGENTIPTPPEGI